MPTTFFPPFSRSLKAILLVPALLLGLSLFSQGLTGLWVGNLHNDSASVRKDQSFEIALTEYRGKVYGYSRSEFIINDTLYYILKRVKGTIKGDVCEVEDDEIISYNFRGKLDKGVRVTSTFRRNKADSSWYLDGTWKTNATKRFYSVSGKVQLQEEKDLASSKIFPHLEELKMAESVAFYKEQKELNEYKPVLRLVRSERVRTEYTANPLLTDEPSPGNLSIAQPQLQTSNFPAPVTDTVKAIAIIEPTPANPVVAGEPSPSSVTEPPVIAPTKPLIASADSLRKNLAIKNDRQGEPVVSNSTVQPKNEPPANAIHKAPVNNTLPVQQEGSVSPPVANNNIPVNKTTPDLKPVAKTSPVTPPVTKAASNEIKKTEPAQPVVAKNDTPVNVPVQPASSDPVQRNVPVPEKALVSANPIPATTLPAVNPIEKSAMISGRKSEFNQEVQFSSDSLELALYDNGEIDGDTVSVYLDGELLLGHQGLKASAIKKTIAVPRDHDNFTIVMFAESLGTRPPNTGLLVVHDGEETYHVRFSSDFQKSTGIVFKRKR